MVSFLQTVFKWWGNRLKFIRDTGRILFLCFTRAHTFPAIREIPSSNKSKTFVTGRQTQIQEIIEDDSTLKYMVTDWCIISRLCLQ